MLTVYIHHIAPYSMFTYVDSRKVYAAEHSNIVGPSISQERVHPLRGCHPVYPSPDRK
jgi:hypothetical protein